jgi:FixJ family two-component response regulator
MEMSPPLVVVVDDDASMLQAIERLLGAGGYRVMAFRSAEEALGSRCLRDADCMVLDMRLPGQDGHHFYASLARPRPPALFISADDSPATRRMALGAGGTGFLAKPFEGSALLDWVRVAAQSISTEPPSRGFS